MGSNAENEGSDSFDWDTEDEQEFMLPSRANPRCFGNGVVGCLDEDDDAKVKRAFQTLLTYVGNVAKNPDVEKFRKIRLTNQSFQDSAPTSRVVGTIGYIAPEMHYGMPSTQTDVYAFGAFLLEVACGRRPNLVAERGLLLVDWVLSSMKENAILNTVDKKLGGEYAEEEMLLVLKLGLLCCRFDPSARPTIQKIVQYLGGDASEADLRALHMTNEAPVRHGWGGNTSPLSASGTHVGSTSSGNDPTPSRQSGSPSSVIEAGPSVIRNAFTR